MARRTLIVDGERQEVYPSGRVTVYGRDQFGLIFEHGTGPQRRRRVTHYSPLGSRSPERAFAPFCPSNFAALATASFSLSVNCRRKSSG